jgi:hypothetical protein
MDEVRKGTQDDVGRLPEMCWDDISEPGAYLLITAGLLARIYPEELPAHRRARWSGARVAQLSSNPGDSLNALRDTAARFRYTVNF